MILLHELGGKRRSSTVPQDLACAKLELDRDAVIESYAGMLPDGLDASSGEERRRLYGMVRLEVAPSPDGLEVSGALGTSNPVQQLRDETGYWSTAAW